MWVSVLLALKFYWKKDLVGCAAGGQVLDIKHLKKVQGLHKFERKYRILRNWRVQTACLFACLAILPLSVLMLQFGLEPFLASLEDMQQINDEVDSRAYRAIQIFTQLHESQGALDHLKKNSTFVKTSLEMDMICPDFNPNVILQGNDNPSLNSTESGSATATTLDFNALLGFDPLEVSETITAGFAQVEDFFSYGTQSAADTLLQVTEFTKAVDEGIDSIYRNDWIVRMGVVVLDVVIVFLVMAIFLSKHSIDYPAYQQLATWVLVPLFLCALAASVVGTCVFVTMAIVNAGTCGT